MKQIFAKTNEQLPLCAEAYNLLPTSESDKNSSEGKSNNANDNMYLNNDKKSGLDNSF